MSTGKFDAILNELGSRYYPVGSVVITSTNVGTTYMSNLYGGTWALYRKRFAEARVTDAFTFNTTNTQNGASECRIYKDSILVRLTYRPKVSFAEDTLTIATYDCTKLGIASSSSVYAQYFTAVSDGLNSLDLFGVSGTTVSHYDIITKTTATSVAANSSYGWTTTFPLSFSGAPSTMIDSFCDEFWWVRTA